MVRAKFTRFYSTFIDIMEKYFQRLTVILVNSKLTEDADKLDCLIDYFLPSLYSCISDATMYDEAVNLLIKKVKFLQDTISIPVGNNLEKHKINFYKNRNY